MVEPCSDGTVLTSIILGSERTGDRGKESPGFYSTAAYRTTILYKLIASHFPVMFTA
jgi:hypothetical protein